jgi:hypothetical protein
MSFFSWNGDVVGRLDRGAIVSEPKAPTPVELWAALRVREVIARCFKLAITEHLRLAEELRKKA